MICNKCEGKGLTWSHGYDCDSVTCKECGGSGKNAYLVTEQAPPIRNNLPAVWDLVQTDFTARDQEGRRKYSVPLQPHNGRDALVDAYQEALDLVVYLRQAIYERDGR